MIELRKLSKRYGAFYAVDGLSLKIPKGQVVGLLGPNGAGKTTTIRMLTGYLPPTAGQSIVDGFDSVTQSREVRQRLGYLPESNPLYTEMKVEEYLNFRGRIFGMERERRRAAVSRVISRCWLEEMRKRAIGRLSKGYRQRVGLAAAMLHSPSVLVLDEPTSGLDPVQIRETRHLIRELAGEHTMVLSSHILPEVEMTCDRVVIISRGQVKADGTVPELRAMAGQAGHYVVELHSGQSGGGAGDAFRNIQGVERVDTVRSDGWVRLEIHAREGAPDLREALGQAVNKTGLICRELHRDSASLEQLFIRITSGVESRDDLPLTAAPERTVSQGNTDGAAGGSVVVGITDGKESA